MTRAPSALGQGILALICVFPILATVYQTLVLTDLADDLILKGIEADSRDNIWISATWGLTTLYGVFVGLGLSKKTGPRNTLILSMGIFTLGNFLCGHASSLQGMILARAVEGIGKGMTIVLLRSYLYSRFDRMLLAAVLVYGLFAYATRGTSPLLASMAAEALSWRWIYWSNIPLGLLSMLLLWSFMPADQAPRPPAEKPTDKAEIDPLLIHGLVAWLISLLFVFGWNRQEGGTTSNFFTTILAISWGLFALVFYRLVLSLTRSTHLSRILRSQTYLAAMGGRMLLLVHLAAVFGLLSKYMVNLRGYPRETAGWVFVPVTLGLALSFWFCARIRDRDWRHLTLVVGAVGTSATLLKLSNLDLATTHRDLSLTLFVWSLFLGTFPASFLIDEVESMRKEDLPVAGALAILCLATPLIIVPSIMSTAISNGNDIAFDAQRRNLRSGRPVVGATLERAVRELDHRGLDAGQIAAVSAGSLGAMVKLQSASMGIQAGLRTLAMATGILGLVVSGCLLLFPGPRWVEVK